MKCSPVPDTNRRRLLKGLFSGGVMMALPTWLEAGPGGPARQPMQVMEGHEFKLTIARIPVNFTGSIRMATAINGSIPGPVLRWKEGDTVTVHIENRLQEETSIHWHGIILPYDMDGVPGVSYQGIAPRETFSYRFKVRQSGTYWYHSHSGMQEQTGVYGAIIIDPAGSDPIVADRDYIVQLSDWTDEDPMTILAKLKIESGYYNFNQLTAVDFFRDVRRLGLTSAIEQRHMWNRMRMSPTDVSDISGHTYSYLMNGATVKDNWTALFRPGERVRLRFINSGAQTFFDVRIPGLKMTVVQADGQNVEPVEVDEIRMAVSETYDVIVTPTDVAYTVFAQSMDRSGYARGTLATQAGMTAHIPDPDPPEPLSMADMMGGMMHDGHDGHASAGKRARARHARSEYGASVDMRVDWPRTNLDDPGVGLRNNGRRVLTYADLRTPGGASDSRPAEREIELHLTGNMARYSWSLDGLEFGGSTPIHFRYGERVRVILVNDTMMVHPMHLHGMWSDLESPGGVFQVRKHVIAVQPAQRISFLVTADAPGYWPWHCHLFYHMHSGMFRVVVVD
ncbi:MAG: copper resistance system multicopper oxidase [Gammaproteobacteria bacterium]